MPALREGIGAGPRWLCRHLRDAAVGGPGVVIALRVRRFRCGNAAWPAVTFAEQVMVAQLLAVAIAVPAIVNVNEGNVLSISTLQGWRSVPLRSMLSKIWRLAR